MLLRISWPNFNQNSIWKTVSTSIFNELSGGKSRLFISVLVFSLERVKYWQKLVFLNFGKNTYVKFHAFENILVKIQPKCNLKHNFYQSFQRAFRWKKSFVHSVLVFFLERVKYWQKLCFLKKFAKNTYVKFHAFENILAKFQPKFNFKHSFY